jgi:hypothetical protein
MSPTGCLWALLKGVLSVIFVALGIMAIVSGITNRSLQDIAVAAICGGIAALPWVMHLESERRKFLAGLAAIVLGLVFAYMAYLSLIGGMQFPANCSGNRPQKCLFFNWLYEIGGLPMIAGVFLLFGVLCVFGGGDILKSTLNRKKR